VTSAGAGVQSLLRAYADLLTAYGPKLGLLGPKEVPLIWERHILESLRGLACLLEGDSLIVDVGSGGGLPGVPIAVVSPERRVVLLEKNARRGSFLELVVERLSLANVSVVLGRTDQVSLEADVCLARAFASADQTWQEAQRLLNPWGRVIYYAGRSWNHHMQDTLQRSGAIVSVCSEAEHRWQGPIVSISSHSG